MAQFRTKARAVELLGKGQIADLPTAISELWKNGYDAYANKLQCGLYMPGYSDVKVPVFTLSDNGFGMSKDDLLNKWIVLGTDSKARGARILTDKERFGLQSRIPMGEKGIGRLSVAYLGSPMLMLTKKANQPMQMLFIDWRILENYNLFVDDIEIPVESCLIYEDFESTLAGMLLAFQENFLGSNSEAWSEQKAVADKIIDDVRGVQIPSIIKKEIVKSFFDDNYHGTSFIVFTPDEQLVDLGRQDVFAEDSDKIREIQQSLSGIYNLFIDKPDFSTEFVIYDNTGTRNIIKDFFEHSDFENVDHYIKGSFDANGMFTGTVRVYRETYPFEYRPIRVPGKTPYGPFDLELGVIEGNKVASIMTPEQYAHYDSMTTRFGALYIYRDKFRVLPYGRTETDFLSFEERRSKHAGNYFFSHRRMFGYVGITRQDNKALTDKAGREGFIENKAFREFKRDLSDFFIEVARVYFKSVDDKKGESNAHSRQQHEIELANKKILEEEEKRNKLTKAKFNSDLKESQQKLISLEQDVVALQGEISVCAEKFQCDFNQYTELVTLLNKKKNELRSLKIIKPSRISLSSGQEQRYQKYKTTYENVYEVLRACNENSEKIRGQFGVENLKRDFETQYAMAVREVSALIAGYAKRFSVVSDDLQGQLKNEQMAYMNSFKQQVAESCEDMSTREDYQRGIELILSLGESMRDEIEKRLLPFINHVENLNLEVDDDVLVKWYKDERQKLNEKLEATDSLAQLGISVEIIDHELNSLYGKMARSINLLGNYADTHTEIKDLYSQMHVAFEHMESNYKMLQPLYRTTRRSRTHFTGAYVLDSMKNFFASKIDALDVKITTNEDFDKYEFYTFESIIASVFINVFNNALYWLIPNSNREIRIEYKSETNEILIMNNGPKIEDAYLEDIFTLFYTRRREGRGIGLYLCQKNLRTENMDIYATNNSEYNKLGGACFVIKLN